MHRYEVHGVTLETEYELDARASDDSRVPDLLFAVQPGSAEARTELGDERPVYHGRLDGLGWNLEFVGPLEDAVIVVGRSMRFECAADRIVCHAADPADRQVGDAFLGPVLALWLERRGTLALRGSALVVDRQAIILLASSPSDVELLVAGLAARGANALSQGLVAVEVDERGVRTHLGAGGTPGAPHHPVDVARIVVVEPTSEPVATVAALRDREAVMALLRLSYLAVPVVRYLLQPDRLRRIALLLESVRCSRSSLPVAEASVDEIAQQLMLDPP